MKNLYLFILIIFTLSLSAQDFNNRLFGELDKSELETGILFNSFINFSNIDQVETNHFNSFQFRQAFNELAAGDQQDNFNQVEFFEGISNTVSSRQVHFGLMFSEFETVHPDAIESGLISPGPNGLTRTQSEGELFEKHEKLIASPLSFRVIGQHLKVHFDSSHFLNTGKKEILVIKVDFGDGNGFQVFNPGDIKQISYSDPGIKDWKIEIELEEGTKHMSYSSLLVKQNPSDASRDAGGNCVTFESTIAPDLSGYGESNLAGTGQYQIFLDTADNVLDKPIIVVDGFDPGDGRDIAGIYNLLSYTDSMTGPQNLADYVRSEGYDVIILNFPVYERAVDMAMIDGGADFIERNAMLLVELLNIINASKVGDEENVIIGPSMGGLISRFALNYMENQSIDHETRLFLSFDSPHRGANVPIGIQHQLNYLAFGLGANNVVELQPIINELLLSSAARQMLVDHLNGHLANGSTVDFDPAKLNPEADPWRSVFQSNINGLTPNGFPQNVRLVSIINGSGINARYPDKTGNSVEPGFTLIDDTFEVAFLTFLTSEINYTPPVSAGISQISRIFLTAFSIPLVNVTASAQAFPYSDGVDAGSGGLFDIGGLTGTVTPGSLAEDFVNAFRADYFNFIPSLSGMALDISPNGEIDWFHDIDIGSGSPPSEANHDVLNSTPFVNWFMPDDNEDHVLLTEANVAFALTEIIPETLDLPEADMFGIGIGQNPISDELLILSNQSFEEVSLVMTDMAGRVVFNSIVSLNNGRNRFSIPLSSGLYLLNIRNTELNHSVKIIVDR